MRVPSTDGVQVAVHDLGGSGDPLLISHATGFCGRTYEPLAAALADHFHVWALDYRAHGDTPSPGTDLLTWDRMTEDLEAVVDAIAPVGVVGHSMGGACALLLESRRPGTFRWLYVFEPIVMPVDLPPEMRPEREGGLQEGAARRRATFPSRAAVLHRYAGRPPLSSLRADALFAYVEHGFRDDPDGSVNLKCAPADEAATFGGAGLVTVRDLATIETPVTVATGAPDGGFPAMLGPRQVEALPKGRLERHDELGHFGPLEAPVLVASRILAMAGG